MGRSFRCRTPPRSRSCVGALPEADRRADRRSEFVHAGLEQRQELLHKAVVIVGHVSYYPKFGFLRASTYGLTCELAVPDDAVGPRATRGQLHQEMWRTAPRLDAGITESFLGGSMDIAGLLIQLLSGAAGGNVAGSLLKKFSLGTVGNSIVGILGGGLGGQLLGMLGVGGAGAGATPAAGGLDIAAILSSVAGGGVGGGILMTVVGLIRQAMSKSS